MSGKLEASFMLKASLREDWQKRFLMYQPYPTTLYLANGSMLIVKSYEEHHQFISEACKYYKQTGRRHPNLTLMVTYGHMPDVNEIRDYTSLYQGWWQTTFGPVPPELIRYIKPKKKKSKVTTYYEPI